MTAPERRGAWEPFWEHATSVADHGAEMVAWLQGARRGHPGHAGTPDRETAELTAYLVELNSAGLITVGSQPSAWSPARQQRAFLDAYGEPGLVRSVVRDLRSAGLTVDSWSTVLVAPEHRAYGRRTAVSRTAAANVTFVGRWSVQDALCDIDTLSSAARIHQQLLSTMSLTAWDPAWPNEIDPGTQRLFAAAVDSVNPQSPSGRGQPA